MTKLEAMSRLYKYRAAEENSDFIGILKALGVPLDLAEDMDFDEVMGVISVRLADLMRLVGLNIPNGNGSGNGNGN